MAKQKIKDAYAQMPENKREIFRGLLENAEFLEEQLRILRDIISEKGNAEDYKNGENQYGRKKSAEATVYATYMKLYLQAVKQINDLIPADGDKADEFLAFVSK